MFEESTDPGTHDGAVGASGDGPARGGSPDARWAAGLNERQFEAAADRTGHLRIIAGAGTGKTGTLAARVASLIDSGVDPDRILLLTFTRRAAAEMLDRVGAMTDRRWAGAVWGGTFHSVANRLLRVNAEPIGLSPSFTVLDGSDVVDLMGLVRAEETDLVKGRRFPRAETLTGMHSRMVNSQEKLAEVVTSHYPWCSEHVDRIRGVLRRYQARKRATGVLDFDDLLLHWRALCVAPDAGAGLRHRFDHVLVDEYQDTNALQADIVRALAEGATVTVVGDDAQAIYGFRSADADNLHRFADVVGGCHSVVLEQNYRSTTNVLGVANGLLAQSERHVDKELWSTLGCGPRPVLVTCATEAAQSGWVADRVLAMREEGVPLGEQAILVRAARHSEHLELELTRRRIPFVKFGGLKFLEAAHVKDLMALLRVLDNPADELAWSRVLRSLPGVGPATVARVMAEIEVDGAGDALERFLAGAGVLPSAATDAGAVLRAGWGECRRRQRLGDLDPAADIDCMREFCAAVFPHSYDNAVPRLADLDQLAATAGGYSERSRFLAELVLDPPERTGDLATEPHLDDEYLTISTVHSAKGGEWRSVTVLHAADGNIPSDMSLSEPDGIEEERRLLYVAVTRAREHLAITYPLRYHVHRNRMDDRHHLAQLSRFLQPLRDRFDDEVTVVGEQLDVSMIDSVDLADEVDLVIEGLLE